MFKLCNFLTLLKDCTGWVIDAKITGILYPPGKTNFFLLTENGFKGEWTALNVTNPIWNQHDWHNRNTVLTVIVNFFYNETFFLVWVQLSGCFYGVWWPHFYTLKCKIKAFDVTGTWTQILLCTCLGIEWKAKFTEDSSMFEKGS